MRWIMTGLAALGFAMVFVSHSPLVLGLGLLLGFAGLFGAVMALAADRIASHSRPESVMLTREDLAAMRARADTQSPAVSPPGVPVRPPSDAGGSKPS